MEQAEQKVVYDDRDGFTRILRGRVNIEGGFVVVTRRDGVYRFALHAVREIVPAHRGHNLFGDSEHGEHGEHRGTTNESVEIRTLDARGVLTA